MGVLHIPVHHTRLESTVPDIHIVSFGYGHAPAPTAHLTIDLRHHFRDPHVSPEMRDLTADDQQVVDAVLATPGIRPLVHGIAAAIDGFAAGPTGGPLTVAAGCAGGRHRAPVFARTLLHRLIDNGHIVSITHRDLDKAVINR